MSSFVQLKAAREKILEFARAVQKTVWEAVDTGNKDLFDSSIRRLELNELYVAVIGLQGVGKSSLLNALLFSKRVFPMDVDETTSCLTYVRNCDEQGERAEVVFEDGRVEVGPASEEFLRSFVDFQHNPDNIMKVLHVNVYAKSKILEHGVVLVDTPGVLSLTSSTHNVTMEFLPQISLGIYVMRTAPTITKDDFKFLLATWRHARNFLFVQNYYDIEVGGLDIALDRNRKILEEIANQSGYAGNCKIYPVDVHAAVSAAFGDDSSRLEASGLRSLLVAVESTLASGPAIANIEFNGATIIHGIQQARQAAMVRLTSLEGEAVQSGQAFDEQQQAAYEDLDRIRADWDEKRRSFLESSSECIDLFRAESARGIDEKEDGLIRLIETGDLDPARFEKVVSERMNEAIAGPKRTFEREFMIRVDEYIQASKNSLMRIERTAFGRFNIDTDVMFLEELVEGAGDGLATIGGLGFAFIGGIVLNGIVAGEGLAAAFAAVPGVGWAIAAGVLIVGLAVKGIAGAVIKRKLKEQLRKYTSHIRNTTVPKCVEAIKKTRGEIDRSLHAGMEAALGQQRKNLARLASDRRKSESERRDLIEGLKLSLKDLDDARSGILKLISKVRGGHANE